MDAMACFLGVRATMPPLDNTSAKKFRDYIASHAGL
jgi:hypothetical protein